MLVLGADNVVSAIGFQVGGEFFVENLGALVGSQNCWVAGEVGYESLVGVDVVVLRSEDVARRAYWLEMRCRVIT